MKTGAKRFEGTFILAPTGSGKTTLLNYLISNDIRLIPDVSVIAMDYSADFLRALLKTEDFHPDHGRLKDRVIIIEPDVVNPIALNPFAYGKERLGKYGPREKEKLTNTTIEVLSHAFSIMGDGGKFTPRQALLYRHCVRLCLVIPGATLTTLSSIFTRASIEGFEKYLPLLDETAQTFFQYEFVNFKKVCEEVSWRLSAVLENTTLAKMLNAPTCKVDFFEALNDGKIIIINTDRDLIGEERAGVFGRLMIALVRLAMRERDPIPENKRKPAYFYIDECFMAGTPVLTPNGYKPIEKIKPGELVKTAIGFRPVRKTMHRPASELVELSLSNGDVLTVTPNHHFFTDSGWVAAGDLTSTHVLLHYYSVDAIMQGYELPHLWKEGHSKKEQDLFTELWREVELETECEEVDGGNTESRPRTPRVGASIFSSYVAQQSNEGPCVTSQDARNPAADRTSAQSTRWQWATDAFCPEDTLSRTRRWLGSGTRCPDRWERKRTSDPLQNRHCSSDCEDSGGIGRTFSQHAGSERPGQEEDHLSSWQGVEGISVQKSVRKRPHKENLLVFNLAVAGHPSYVVGEVLAHNCHTYLDNDNQVASMLDDIRKSKLAMTFVTQRLAKLTDPNVRDALLTCGILLVKPNPDDAKRVATYARQDGDYLAALPPFVFYSAIRGVTSGEVRVPNFHFETAVSFADQDRLMRRNRERYGYSVQEKPKAKPPKKPKPDALPKSKRL